IRCSPPYRGDRVWKRFPNRRRHTVAQLQCLSTFNAQFGPTSAISCTEYSGIETGAAAGARGLRPGLRAGFQPASQKLGVQPPVQPWSLAQLLMGALLDDAAPIHHDDAVGQLHRRGPVGNEDDGAALADA